MSSQYSNPIDCVYRDTASIEDLDTPAKPRLRQGIGLCRGKMQVSRQKSKVDPLAHVFCMSSPTKTCGESIASPYSLKVR